MEEKTLTCRDCGVEFTFSVREQEFYKEKGFMHEPARCPACRSARRGQRPSNGQQSGPRQMYPAICAQCGKETEVPFQPRTDKPVYCIDCFRENKANSR